MNTEGVSRRSLVGAVAALSATVAGLGAAQALGEETVKGAEATPTLEEVAERLAALEERVAALEGDGTTGDAEVADGEWKAILGGDYLIGRDLPAGRVTIRVNNDTDGYAVYEPYADSEALANETYITSTRIDTGESFGTGLEEGMYLRVRIVTLDLGNEKEAPVAEYSVQPFAVQAASADQPA